MRACLNTGFTLALIFSAVAFALEPVFSDRSGNAINGYDAVAYFTENKPVEGNDAFVHAWNGGTWKFSSADNLQAFMADPEKYAPQFGGYCAWAVSQGYTASTDPDAWHIHEGRLYLNYNKSIQRKWQRDTPGNISAGNANWPDLLAN